MRSMAHKLLFKWSNTQDIKRGITDVWRDNALKNIPYFDAHPEKVIGSIHKMPKYEGKAAIFIGRGPSLQKAIRMFDAIDDRFITICTNSSLRYLLDNGVVPDYMILIDGEPGKWNFDNLSEDAKNITALFATGAYHEEVIKWPGKIMVIPYGMKHGDVGKEVRRRYGKSIAAGGNALNGAIAVFLTTTLIKVYAFVGNNLSFKEGENFYFDAGATDRDEKAYFIMHDIYGEECYTDLPMYQYKVWLEQTCNTFYPECYFVNCSEGILGVDVDNTIMPIFDHMPLDDAIVRIKDALDFEVKPLIDRCKDFYQRIYDYGIYHPSQSSQVWPMIMEHIDEDILPKFKKAIDVGCGSGDGIKIARDAGYDVYGVDIVDNKKMWEENGITDVCFAAPAHEMPFPDNSFDFLYCGDVLEHIPHEFLLPSLKEMFRIGSGMFLLAISSKLEDHPVGAKVMTHVSVKQPDEWKNLITEAGFKIDSFAVEAETCHFVVIARKEGICQE